MTEVAAYGLGVGGTHGGGGASCDPVGVRPARRSRAVYEVVSGQPTWSSLFKLAVENVAELATRAIVRAIKTYGRTGSGCEHALLSLRRHLLSELPASLMKEVLNVCAAHDRFRCHHNPTDCLALEIWRVLFCEKHADVGIVHHEFAFPKTSNYPDILCNLDRLLCLMSESGENATTTSFKLELKQCEISYYLEDRLVGCLTQFRQLRVLEVPGLATDKLLNVIALACTNLEVLNLPGCREQVSDAGFAKFVQLAQCRPVLRKLDVSRCALSHQSLVPLHHMTALAELKVSTTILDEINWNCDGQAVLLAPAVPQQAAAASETASAVSLLGGDQGLSLGSVAVVTVENDSYVQVSINKVISYLRHVFPNAADVQLVNCIACELHVTLTQHPTNITFMRETINTLELISADYFNFPRLVYPCPNLETLHIEKPTNDVFNIDQQNVPFLYGNTVPFINLRHLKLSRISLTNLAHFLSKSSNLRKFKVTNIGRRERPRWTDQRIQQILPADSVPFLEHFHVSCLPNEGFSTSDTHRYLHLTKLTVQYLTENFPRLTSIAGIESWLPKDCDKESLRAMFNSSKNAKTFSITSI